MFHILRNYRFSTFRWVTNCLETIEQTDSRKQKMILFQNIIDDARKFNLLEPLIKFTLCEMNQKSQLIESAVPERTLCSVISKTFNLNLQEVQRCSGEITNHDGFAKVFDEFPAQINSLDFSIIFAKIQQIFDLAGTGRETQQEKYVEELLRQCSSIQEVKFIIRCLKKAMRVGLSTKSISKLLSEEENKLILGFQKSVNQVGIPILPQLAKGIKADKESEEWQLNPKQIENEFIKGQTVYLEYKYDGERLQVHYSNGQVRLFGRSLDEKTEQFQNLSLQLQQYFESKQIQHVIFDCEMICYENGKILPFQEMQNKSYQISDHLSLVCFDILYYNSQNVLSLTLSERQKIYQSLLPPIMNERQVISYVISHKFEQSIQIEKLFDDAINCGLEGIMIKRDTNYTPGLRNDWLKIKRQKDADLVVVGGYYGQGKRSKWIGAYLLAALDDETGKLYPIAKLGTGLTDNEFEKLTQRYQNQQSKEQNDMIVPIKAKPDFWVEPQNVWEITYDTISKSPTYPVLGNLLDDGISIRFPRFKRERVDKKISNCTTIKQLVEEYLKQK